MRQSTARVRCRSAWPSPTTLSIVVTNALRAAAQTPGGRPRAGRDRRAGPTCSAGDSTAGPDDGVWRLTVRLPRGRS